MIPSRILNPMFFIWVLAAGAIVLSSPALGARFASTTGLLIEYDFRSDGPVNTNPAPLVRVYGDGRLQVARPWFRRDAGYYSGQLSALELETLLRAIEDSGIADMQPQALADRKNQATPGVGQLVSYSSETETTVFRFSLSGAKTMTRTVWRNLRSDAGTHGARVGEYGTLWQIDRMLHALNQHPSLEKYDEIAGGVQQ